MEFCLEKFAQSSGGIQVADYTLRFSANSSTTQNSPQTNKATQNNTQNVSAARLNASKAAEKPAKISKTSVLVKNDSKSVFFGNNLYI